MKNCFLYIATGLVLLLSACSQDETDDLFREYMTPQALLSDIAVTLTEQRPDSLATEEAGIYVYIETTETYPFCNYGILRNTFQRGDTLLIRLEDVVKPGIALSPAGPASTSVKVAENTRHIIFLRGQDSDTFELTIEEDALVLQPVSTSFTTTDHVIYLRQTETKQ